MEVQTGAVVDFSSDTDMFEFPEHIKLNYTGVVSEPDYFGDGPVVNCFKPVSACLNKSYDSIHVTTYYVLSVLLGSVLSVLWGLVFGIVNFATVWFVQPFIKLFFTAFRCGYMVSRTWTRMFCDPCFESIALCFTKIRGNFNVHVHGVTVEKV